MIKNPAELANEIGVERPELIAKALFKSTECGVAFSYDEARIIVSGYAEGADAECPPHKLAFPFTSETFWQEVTAADEEGAEMWHEWNDELEV